MIHVFIDGTAVSSMADIHRILAEQLDFPAWYGNNLDALHDCLTDLTEEVGIYILHERELMAALGPAYPQLRRVLIDSAKESPYLQIQFS